MGQGYYRPIKTKRLVALLIRQGFVSAGGTKHGKYIRPDSTEAVKEALLIRERFSGYYRELRSSVDTPRLPVACKK